LEEEIKYRTEIVKILAFYLLTIGGGLVGLIFHLNSFLKYLVFTLGILIFGLIGFILLLEHKRVIALIKKLEDLKNDD